MAELATYSEGSQSNNYTFSEIERMAGAIVKSGLFGVKTTDQALALLLLSQAENIHPVCGARDYHIIQNRPSMKAETMLARFQANGGKVEWTCYTDKKVSGIFSHPSSGRLEFEWTFERAKAIGLTSKDNWKHYPQAMLRSRVISEAVRTMLPGVLSGMYTDEEVESFVTVDAGPVKPPYTEPQEKKKDPEKKSERPAETAKPPVINADPPVEKDTITDAEKEAVQLAINEKMTGKTDAVRKELAADLRKKYGIALLGDIKKKDLLNVLEDIQIWEPANG